MQADMKLLLFLPAAQAHPMQVIDVAPGHDAAAIWAAACKRIESRMDSAAPLLLLPEGYSLLPGDKVQQASHMSSGARPAGLCESCLLPDMHAMHPCLPRRTVAQPGAGAAQRVSCLSDGLGPEALPAALRSRGRPWRISASACSLERRLPAGHAGAAADC